MFGKKRPQQNNPTYDNVGFEPEQPKDDQNFEKIRENELNEGVLSGSNQEDLPTIETAIFQYEVDPKIPISQKENLEINSPFYGRHVALGNIVRYDNLHHLDNVDTVLLYDECPTLRHMGDEIRLLDITETQLCRANQETGGFTAKLLRTGIERKSIDLKETKPQGFLKKRRFFGLFGG